MIRLSPSNTDPPFLSLGELDISSRLPSLEEQELTLLQAIIDVVLEGDEILYLLFVRHNSEGLTSSILGRTVLGLVQISKILYMIVIFLL